MKNIVLVTGGFDPLHSGHIAYFKAAKTLGDYLIVGINSDEWLERKKGRAFMPWNERLCVINNLSMVDEVYTFDDSDNSAKALIKQVRAHYPESKIIFANGGDRTKENIPEMDAGVDNVEFVFGVGGENKMNSSSWILQEWKTPKTERQWGYYRVLHEPNKRVKLKELTVDPGKTLSMQRHTDRAEFWFVSEGEASLYTINVKTDAELVGKFTEHQHMWIPKTAWHQLANESDKELKVIEIQFGDQCIEEDIERK